MKLKDIEVREKLSLAHDGTGNVTGSGTGDKLIINHSGNGDVSLESLTAVNCDVDNSGNGQVKVRVTGNLRAKVHGTGNIIYYGTPRDLKSEREDGPSVGHVRQAANR